VVNKDNPAAIIKPGPAPTGFIQKIFDKMGSTGIDQVYIITNKGKTDTVALFIPDLKEELLKPSAGNNREDQKRRQSTANPVNTVAILIRQTAFSK
jgi:hypothetical protein